jgi:predicted AAA+ superfamily ATPase
MADPALLARHLTPALEAATSDTPVVLLVGPRQAGKTTLCEQVARRRRARVLTLDDPATLAAAQLDPTGFIAALEGPVVIDEIQRAPELLPVVKLSVDRARHPGRFLLTGSAQVLALPNVSESLAGRMEVLTLWPLSQGEMERHREGFVDALFGTAVPRWRSTPEARAKVIERALRGGYPEIMKRRDAARRRAWFGSYVTTLLQRDVRDLARIEGLSELPRLLALLAARASSLANVAELSRSAGIPHTTLARYLTLFEHTFLIRPLPAWSGSRSRRLIRTPRMMLMDTGLLSHLAGITATRLSEESTPVGPLLENFVAVELWKQLGWSETRAELFHFRSHTGHEVDLVLESDDGRIVGVEVKAASTLRSEDFRGLAALREIAARRFHRGIVLYTGREALPFGDGVWGVPMTAVWGS